MGFVERNWNAEATRSYIKVGTSILMQRTQISSCKITIDLINFRCKLLGHMLNTFIIIKLSEENSGKAETEQIKNDEVDKR